MKFSRQLVLGLLVLLACVGCDQATKVVAKQSLGEYEIVSMLGGSVRLQLAKNYGTFLSLGASLAPGMRTALTTLGVGVILLGLIAYLFISKPDNPIVTVAIALFVGGGLSNLIDRVIYGGYVLDFLNVGIGPVRTGIFNVADMFIMAAVGMLLFAEPLGRRFTRRPSSA